jgi:hypothetical protein
LRAVCRNCARTSTAATRMTSLLHCVTPLLRHSSTASLLHCVTPPLRHSSTASLLHCVTPPLRHSSTASLMHHRHHCTSVNDTRAL